MSQVKNRAPAAIQISAEQLLREARERQIDEEVSTAQRENMLKRQQINDPQELAMYQAQKRRDFEEKLRHTLHNLQSYLRYADWEASQLEFRRARSIYERALNVDYRDFTVWIKYAEFEMKNKFVNHARNVWNRAVALLPRVSQLWYKYIHMEEMLGQVENARVLFNRWMQWEPEDQAWFSFINFEERVGQIPKARDVYERYCATHITAVAYLKYGKWEERHEQLALARSVYERAVTEVPLHAVKPNFYIEFAKFEERCKEYDRARAIFKHSLETFPKEEAKELYLEFVIFEKKHGTRQGIDGVILSKSRLRYEKELEENPRNYDVWFDFVRLEEAEAVAEANRLAKRATSESKEDEEMDDSRVLLELIRKGREKVRDVYERAVANMPLVTEKKYWKRYIYLWIYYALFEELQVQDIARAREVYQACLRVIPHDRFTFGKVWIMAAKLEVRQKDLDAARKLLGRALGMCPKASLFNYYIKLEKHLGNTNRCRKLYEKQLETNPQDCEVWVKYAALEEQVKEEKRCRALFELAITQKNLDMPELLWKKYIDFEISLKTKEPVERVETLYERLLERTKHVKVWISFGKFLGLSKKSAADARSLFDRAYRDLKGLEGESKEERASLLQAWKDVEEDMIKQSIEGASEEQVSAVEGKMPKRLKKRRQIQGEEGSTEGWEEYYDYVFPDDPKTSKGLKLLEIAQKWKRTGGLSDVLKEAKKSKAAEANDTNEIDLDDL